MFTGDLTEVLADFLETAPVESFERLPLLLLRIRDKKLTAVEEKWYSMWCGRTWFKLNDEYVDPNGSGEVFYTIAEVEAAIKKWYELRETELSL